MKKVISMLLILVMVFSLAGCGEKKTSTTTEPKSTDAATEEASEAPTDETEAPVAGERVVIKLAAQADSTPATKAVIEAFNASQEKYTAEWVDMTNDSGAMREQLITSLKAGSTDYDVVSLDVVWAGEFAAAGYIEPIDQYMKDAGLSLSQFNAGSMVSGTYNAKQYVLPFFPDLGVLYFRKDIVSAEDAAKLESGSYTYDDLYTMCETYKGKGDTKDSYVFQSALYEGLVCNANEFTANWTDLKGGLETMKKYVEAEFSPDDILNYQEGETANSFIKGDSVFSRNWPYQWGSIKSEGTIKTDQVSIAPLPNGGSVGGWLLAMNKNSVNKDGAWELLQFMSGAEGQKIMSTQGGYLPGFNASLEDADVLASNELLSLPGFQAALLKTIARPVSSEYAKVSDALQQNIHKYLSGSQDVDATVTAIEEAIKAE